MFSLQNTQVVFILTLVWGSSFSQVSHASFLTQGKQLFRVKTLIIHVEEISTLANLSFNTAEYSGQPSIEKASEKASENPLTIVSNAAETFFNIIEKNRPVSTIMSSYVSALPKGAAGDPDRLKGWKPQQIVTFSSDIENLFGMKVIQLVFQVILEAGGSYKGLGQYIRTVSVIPLNINVKWGFKASLTVEVEPVRNVGAEGFPVSAITLGIRTKFESNLFIDELNERILLQGDGFFGNLSTGQIFYGHDFKPVRKRK